MSDNSFEDAEMFLLIEKLVIADSWDNAFALLIQEKETLSEPNAEEYLLARIEQKKLQNAPLAEIDNLAIYLPLLRDEQPGTTLDTNSHERSNYTKGGLFFDQPGLSSETCDTEASIRQEASKNAPDLCPYADPIHWAGFQILGW